MDRERGAKRLQSRRGRISMKTDLSGAGSRRGSRTIWRDIAADWRRWTMRERVAAGALGTVIPVAYVVLTFQTWL
jgi:hypothetical protein